MDLLYYPHEFLNKKLASVKISSIDFNPQQLKTEMVDIMLQHNGIGLSASQVGLDKQLFVMGDSTDNCSMCINPEIMQHTEETIVDVEGCLSFPNIFVQVKRPKEILVQYFDENLEQKRQHLTGYSAKCFLHEYDHLQGITFKDRVSILKWKIAAKKAAKKRYSDARH